MMRGFLKIFLACLSALLVAQLMGFVILISFLAFGVSGVDSVMSSPQTRIADKSVLAIKLGGPLSEQSHRGLPSVLGELLIEEGSLSLPDLLAVLRAVEKDTRIKGVSLHMKGIGGALAQLEELRAALLRLKAKGKFIYAYADHLGQGDYYVASVADCLVLNPVGVFQFNGFILRSMYLKRAFDKLKIQPVVFRVGSYKSAVEPFTRSSMSEESRAQTRALLESVYGTYLTDLGKSRQTSSASLRAWADQYGLWTPEVALENNLISHIGYTETYRALLRKKMNTEEGKKIPHITWRNYAQSALETSATQKTSSRRKKIAVVVAEGAIYEGSSANGRQEGVYADDVVKRLKKLKKDSSVRAVVLRIHSPGGSAYASDKLWKALQELSKVKPVAASMSGVAASGGYYIAAGCDQIFAHRTTITGSIGVWALLFNVGDASRSIGIDFDKLETGPLAALYDFANPMSRKVKAVWQRELERVYDTFLEKAATGRHLSIDDIHEIAQGRVWTGKKAHQIQLVDQVGGLYDAVEWLAAQTNLKEGEYTLQFDSEVSWQQLMRKLIRQMEVKLAFLEPWIQKDMAQKLETYKGIQARCLIDEVIL